jgi:sugar phosphate isomerase/epimerase
MLLQKNVSEEKPKMTKSKFAFMASLDFSEWSLEKVVSALAEIGYTGVELTLSHFNPRQKSSDDLKAMVQLVRKRGLDISEVVVQQDVVTLNEKLREDRIRLVKECIEMASQTGLDIINLFTGPAPWDPEAPKIPKDITEGAAWKIVLDAFNEFVASAEKYKVHLAVEAVFGHLCHDYYTIKELLDNFSSKYLGVNMDPSHYTLYRNDVPWVVKKLGDKIKHVHLKDVVGKPGLPGEDFLFPLLGEGTVDWEGFLNALKDVGYIGFLSVEFESFSYYEKILDRNPVKAAQISMEQIRKLTKI